MFATDNSISYLADDAAQEASNQSQKTIKVQPPQVNNSINLQHMHKENPLEWQSYSERANVAPYSTSYRPPKPLHEHSIDVLGESGGNGSAFKTGILLSSLLLVGSVAGYSLEKMIQKKTPKGYGAIVGSLGAIGLYYIASKTLSSGIMEGVKATGGFVIPMLPIFISMYQGKKLDDKTAMLSAGVGVVASGYVIMTNLMK